MNYNKSIINYLKSNKKRFQKEYHLTKIGVFGSVARNSFTDKSDIDLLVEFENNVHDLYAIKENIRYEIGKKFNRPVDICREKYIKPIFRELIISEAIYV